MFRDKAKDLLDRRSAENQESEKTERLLVGRFQRKSYLQPDIT